MQVFQRKQKANKSYAHCPDAVDKEQRRERFAANQLLEFVISLGTQTQGEEGNESIEMAMDVIW